MSTSDKPRVLLVDGNNVIHAWNDLRQMHRQRRGSAHPELCKRLTSYQDLSGYRVVLVFDGRGNTIVQESEEKGIQIFYTDSGHTADDVIERLAHKYAAKFAITVATDDVMEQDAVIAVGGEAMSCQALLYEVERLEDSFRSEWGL